MKKSILFLLLFIFQFSFAQLTENDVKFWVGTGSKKAYLIADFNDSDNPTSYVWGYRFDDANLTMEDLINAIDAADSKVTAEVPSGFLYSFDYNHHTPNTDDYWSTWSGTSSNNMTTNNGVNNDPLVDGKWYGLSYGYGFTPVTTLGPPSTPVPAYNSAWFNSSQIINWIGTGSNKSVVVIDFNTNNSNGNADSFAFGIQYNGTITAEQALQLIDSQVSEFNYTSAASQISALSLNNFSGNATGNHSWKLYKGKDLSSWRGQTNLSQIQLVNNDWFGLSFGTRIPFTPNVTNITLSVSDAVKQNFKIYPNPASNFVIIETQDTIKDINIYSISGQKVINTQNKKINIQSLQSGIYFVEIKTEKSVTTHKIIKK
ncbi:T9SS type A sorting domain-containing protein [Chryseobacterium turcicum]|uniref:T9SS type A sorting domain-containing protein n=1 Tax=Chryseobacterium turcicum TaxID=2898076 RepID=A0A9Q3V335_9FLAO|nr:T9SS type A sorting domain-containing protein [Chryseobacterium turcicum]MCD1117939.1 T9SS type A sorting domain-containing protein [Chryseobacterium turcicum]